MPCLIIGRVLYCKHRNAVLSSCKTNPVIIFPKCGQRVAIHADEVFGNKEVVIKNLGPQLCVCLVWQAWRSWFPRGRVDLLTRLSHLSMVLLHKSFLPAMRLVVAKSSNGLVVLEQTQEEQQTPLGSLRLSTIQSPCRVCRSYMLQREGFRVVLAVDGFASD